MKFKWFPLLGLAALIAVSSSSEAQQPRAALQSYTIVKTYPHDPKAYTQGLVWNGKGFFESTGNYGSSTLRETTLEGKVLRSVPQDDQYFSEGLAWLGNQLYQLTWTNKKAFVYNATTFKLEGTRAYKTEGWGLTTDGRSLILSDGSSTLYWLEPKTFAVRKTIKVSNAGSEIRNLNELEWINAEIWANIWQTDLIARIDPTTGRVKAFVSLAGLRPEAAQGSTDAVLNGIAYDSKNKRLFVTGKYWDKLYEIKVK
jgi:glutaminyl-peptide cyclotransferase